MDKKNKGLSKSEADDLISDLGSRLYRYFSATIQEDYVSDLVQDVFLRLLPKIKKKNIRSYEDITNYAYGIARKVKLEFFKSWRKEAGLSQKKSLESSPEDIETDDLLEKVAAKHQVKRLRQAMLKLKKEEQEAVSLLVDWQLALKDIAAIMGMPVGTVKSHIHRARYHLKQLLSSSMEFSL